MSAQGGGAVNPILADSVLQCHSERRLLWGPLFLNFPRGPLSLDTLHTMMHLTLSWYMSIPSPHTHRMHNNTMYRHNKQVAGLSAMKQF